MTHKPIQLHDLSLSFPHKICFEDFTTNIPYGSRIAIMGRNGSGKSTLLRMLQGQSTPIDGEAVIPEDAHIAYVPQIIAATDSLSGAQRFNKAFTKALAEDPNVLLLDEPTNHLDVHNRKSLLRLLDAYQGTLIVISHDVELLRHSVNTLWHIDQDKIKIFSGNYDDYLHELEIQKQSLHQQVFELKRQKKEMHQALMQEQVRAKTSRSQGEANIKKRKWPTVVSGAKARRAEQTSGRKKQELNQKKEIFLSQLQEIYIPEAVMPKFSISAADIDNHTLVSINNGAVAYENPIITNINFAVIGNERVAIAGDNGSGKSTLIKAILRDPKVKTSGTWYLPKKEEIGYLDQTYATLNPQKTVLETIQDLVSAWSHAEIRKHLNDFLFRKNEEVNAKVANLSGGERARLSLAQIAAKTPKLLILDEITNNLDLETRNHVIEVLQNYPGALIVISHDQDFLNAININHTYAIKEAKLINSN